PDLSDLRVRNHDPLHLVTGHEDLEHVQLARQSLRIMHYRNIVTSHGHVVRPVHLLKNRLISLNERPRERFRTRGTDRQNRIPTPRLDRLGIDLNPVSETVIRHIPEPLKTSG